MTDLIILLIMSLILYAALLPITARLNDFLGIATRYETYSFHLKPAYKLSYTLLGKGHLWFRDYLCRFSLWIAPKIYPCRMSTTNRKSNLCELCAGRGGWASCEKSRSPELIEAAEAMFREVEWQTTQRRNRWNQN